MEEKCTVGDFLWVGADPGVEDRDGEHEQGELAREAEEAGFEEEVGAVGEVPARQENDGGGEGEGDQYPAQGGFEVGEIPEFAVVEGRVLAEDEEHDDEGEDKQGEYESP